MKKEYVSPTSRAMSIGGEAIMLSTSVPETSGQETDTYFSPSKGGWNSDDWSGGEEE